MQNDYFFKMPFIVSLGTFTVIVSHVYRLATSLQSIFPI